MKTNKQSLYINIGKFKKKSVYDSKVDMSQDVQDMLESLGREHITQEQYINIGFNFALVEGLNQMPKSKYKAKAKVKK